MHQDSLSNSHRPGALWSLRVRWALMKPEIELGTRMTASHTPGRAVYVAHSLPCACFCSGGWGLEVVTHTAVGWRHVEPRVRGREDVSCPTHSPKGR